MIREDVSLCKNVTYRCSTSQPFLQIDTDEFIDVLLGTRKYVPCLYVFNKIDAVSLEEVERLATENEGKNVMISCEMDLGLDILLERIWEELRLVKYDRTISFSMQQAYKILLPFQGSTRRGVAHYRTCQIRSACALARLSKPSVTVFIEVWLLISNMHWCGANQANFLHNRKRYSQTELGKLQSIADFWMHRLVSRIQCTTKMCMFRRNLCILLAY